MHNYQIYEMGSITAWNKILELKWSGFKYGWMELSLHVSLLSKKLNSLLHKKGVHARHIVWNCCCSCCLFVFLFCRIKLFLAMWSGFIIMIMVNVILGFFADNDYMQKEKNPRKKITQNLTWFRDRITCLQYKRPSGIMYRTRNDHYYHLLLTFLMQWVLSNW